MLKNSRSLLLRYGVAVASAALAVGIRGLLTPLWGENLPFLTLFPAVLLSAWYGGLGPGVVTTALGATAASSCWLRPAYSLAPVTLADWIGLGLAVSVMLLIAGLTAALRRSRNAERVQREYLQVTLASIGDAVMVTDAQGTVTFLNRVAETLTGWTAVDAVGKPLSEVFHIVNEETRQPVENPVAKVLRTGVVAGLANHTVLCAKDGRELPIDDNAAPIRDATDRVQGIVLVFRDITQRRQAEETRRQLEDQLRSLIDTTQDAVITIDRRGCIDVFNPAAERIFGYTRAEVQGQNLQLLMPEPYASEHNKYIARYERTGERRAIGRIRSVAARRKNGEVFPIELSVTEFTLGGDVRYGAFIRDISEKVRLQEHLMDRERLAAIGATAAKLVHEIGNPLNGMAVATQLLERRLNRQRETSDEKVLAGIQLLRGEIERLSRLLQEFRSLSRQQQFTLQPTNLITLVQEFVAMESAQYTERGVSIQQHLPQELPLVMADEDKLKQVLLNLGKNAIEAMPDGGTLTLRLHNTGKRITLEVADTGRGIPAGVDIFEPFVTTKPDGTGLGLPIVRQIVAAHNGTLSYTSEPGKGTTFLITLPLPPAEHEGRTP
ncbi:MAG TPA: PAS domain S-box protein [Methylomirabilota bacterium]|jgi:PAS domain S-box-containing protein|nr:PAS domain S-box protein [Methylomirabilota bacterium]